MLDISLPEFFVACGSILLDFIVNGATNWVGTGCFGTKFIYTLHLIQKTHYTHGLNGAIFIQAHQSGVIDKSLLLTEIFDWTNIFVPLESHELPLVSLGASDAWKVLYRECRNRSEFPINIETRGAMVVQHSEPLKWSGYCAQPLAMTMENDGNTVTVTGSWSQNTRPIIQGGPLSESYDFHSMLFHWGSSDEVGSEHIVNGIHYPLELQLIHVKRGFDSPIDAIISGAKYGIAIVSIFYQITSLDNFHLDHVVKNLWCTPRPGMTVSIPPFPLEGLFLPFEKDYYSYCSGSPSQQLDNELLTWIVRAQPSNVSSSQVEKFRSIHLAEVPIPLHSTSIQRLNDRELYYHD